MRFSISFWRIGAALLIAAGALTAQENPNSTYEQALNDRDMDALRAFLDERAMVSIKSEEDGSQITIDADIHVEWRHMCEYIGPYKVRGRGAYFIPLEDYVGTNKNIINALERLPISHNDWDVEFNLHFDYRNDKTWAVAHLQFDNSMGVDNGWLNCSRDPQGWHGSGNNNSINLKQSFFGYRFWKCSDGQSYIELGRRGNLYKVFDSEVQFLSRLDGVLFVFENKLGGIGKYYAKVAGFIVDERVNEYAWAIELGLKNIYDSGLDIKYSFIDWKCFGKNRCRIEDPRGMQFANSQISFYYHIPKCWTWLRQPAMIYCGFLYNHAASNWGFRRHHRDIFSTHSTSHMGKKNKAWYACLTIGEVLKEGDWSFEMMYQWVQAKAVPDNDSAGIGNGNVLGESFTASGRGNTNFQGWKFEGAYALTDQISLDTIVEFTRNIDNIAGSHSYSKVEIEAVYAF